MKKLILLFLLTTGLSNGQELKLMNFYLEPNEAENTVNLNTLVFRYSISIFQNYEINITENSIDVSLCYFNSSAAQSTFDFQEIEINLPPGYSNYTINIKLYGDGDAPPCDNTNLAGEGILNFEYPYNPVEKSSIPDVVFENFIEDLGSGDGIVENGLVLTHRIENLTHLFLNQSMDGQIRNMEGIENFVSLTNLFCWRHLIQNLDLSSNTMLEKLDCSENPLSQLNVSNNINLEYLVCSNNSLITLDLTNNTNLEKLSAGVILMSEIDLTQNIYLIELGISGDNLTSIDLSNNINLIELRISGDNLTSIDLSNNINLIDLYISGDNFTSIDLSNNVNLQLVSLSSTQIESIDMSTLRDLKTFVSYPGQITDLDFSHNAKLEVVFLLINNLSSLNIKNGNNENISQFVAIGDPNLYCIDVDDEEAASNNEFPYSEWNVNSQVVFSEDCSLGVEDVKDKDFSIYPNPVSDALFLQTEQEMTSISIRSILGQEVFSSNMEALSFRVDVSNFRTGTYFVTVTVGNNVTTKKIIKE